MNKLTFRKPKLGEELGSTIAVTAKAQRKDWVSA